MLSASLVSPPHQQPSSQLLTSALHTDSLRRAVQLSDGARIVRLYAEIDADIGVVTL